MSQAAAKAFLSELPRQVKVGIVAFAGSAQVVQPVTLSREDLNAAIDKFQMQRATPFGSAIVIALAELFPDQGIDLDGVARASGRPRAMAIDVTTTISHSSFPPASSEEAGAFTATYFAGHGTSVAHDRKRIRTGAGEW